MTNPPLYRLRDVVRRYESFVLQIESLEVCEGEVLCLLGPTGAGKSTLLRMLALLEGPDGGHVEFDGRKFDERLPLEVRRRVTLVFQRPLVLTGSVRTNVACGLRWRDGSRVDRQRVEWALERFGLSRLASQRAATLSGGQMRLVALARALVVRPDVLLVDEPTSDLDPSRVALVEQALADDRSERGTTVVWATHNLFQARRVAQRIVFLWNGQLIEAAACDEFFECPGDPRTADFVQGKIIY